jgi:NADPH:quinone reductase-like Zn-dependent oxidoreductase
MKMRATVLEWFGERLVVQEVELAEPRAGEVLVRLVACGVRHTDLYTASGADPSGYAPAVLGHEGVGNAAVVVGSNEDDGVVGTCSIASRPPIGCERRLAGRGRRSRGGAGLRRHHRHVPPGFQSGGSWGKKWGKKPHRLQPIPADLDIAKPA